MANRKRNIQVKFYVTAEEKELMEQKMAQLQTKRIGAYLRKMAIDGYIIQVDTKDIKEMNKLCPPLAGTLTKSPSGSTPVAPPIRPIWRKSGKAGSDMALQRRILLSQR